MADPAPARALVLLVEDDLDTRASCAEALRDGGYDVIEATTLWEARESINVRTPDVVVLDLRLPDGNGVAAARAWRKGSRLGATPIIVFTAHPTSMDVEAARLGGCDGFLTKPCTADALLTEIERALAGSRKTGKHPKIQ
jgi:DNA-binding response OmpR family regulator